MDNKEKRYDLYFEVVTHVYAPTDEEAQTAVQAELEKLPDVYQANCTDIFERHLSADKGESE